MFEVSASTYAWDVHDESLDAMLDKMQDLAEINSISLIALMHHEPRLYNAERFPHNLVRDRKTDAFQSRMLYDHERYPAENLNLAELLEYEAHVRHMAELIEAGWKPHQK